jgi:hypothetical protein
VSKRQDPPRALSRSVCVVEVTRDRNNPPMFLQVLVSIAGRESVSQKTWATLNGLVDSHSMMDVTAWVADTVYHAIAASVGIQEGLEL